MALDNAKRWFVAQDIVVPSLPTQVPMAHPKWTPTPNAAIARSVAAMVTQLEAQLACEPQTFAVEQVDGRLSLNAGTNAGLRVGRQAHDCRCLGLAASHP